MLTTCLSPMFLIRFVKRNPCMLKIKQLLCFTTFINLSPMVMMTWEVWDGRDDDHGSCRDGHMSCSPVPGCSMLLPLMTSSAQSLWSLSCDSAVSQYANCSSNVNIGVRTTGSHQAGNTTNTLNTLHSINDQWRLHHHWEACDHWHCTVSKLILKTLLNQPSGESLILDKYNWAKTTIW